MPPTVCQSTRMSSETALLLQAQASHATWSSKPRVNLLAAERAHSTASDLTPCSGHLTLVGAYYT